MSTPGWYPDPAGTPGQFRYWSGTAWSAGTTANPGPEPGSGPGPGPQGTPPGPKPRRTRLIIAIAAALVLIVVASIAAIRLFTPTDPGIVTPPPSVSTAPSDPASPTEPVPTPTHEPTADPTPTEPATPSSPATPSPQPSSTAVGCPPGDPLFRQDHPTDNRIHGGGLSFPKVTGYSSTTTQDAFFWAYDVDGQQKTISTNWSSLYAVGAVPTFNGFDSPRTAAELILQCTVTSTKFYQGVTRVRPLSAKPITVGGQSGWSLRAEVRVRTAGVTIPGDIVQIIVVDTESPESLSMFWACVPLDDAASLTQLDATIKKLRPEQ